MDATFEMTFFHAPADPDTLTPGAAAPAVTDALNAWNTGACSGIRFEDGGEVETGDPSFDGLNVIYWDDPAHNIEADILAVTYTVGTTDAGPGDPDRLEVDIVLNDGLRWYTEAEIAAGECTDGYSILGVLIHELGHGAKVDHDNAGAAMDWSSSGACAAAVLPDAQDLAALRAVWGPTVSVVCEDPANTPVPVS